MMNSEMFECPFSQSLIALQKIHKFGFELVDQPPNFPDLAPSDYYVFLKLKKHVKSKKKDNFFSKGLELLYERSHVE